MPYRATMPWAATIHDPVGCDDAMSRGTATGSGDLRALGCDDEMSSEATSSDATGCDDSAYDETMGCDARMPPRPRKSDMSGLCEHLPWPEKREPRVELEWSNCAVAMQCEDNAMLRADPCADFGEELRRTPATDFAPRPDDPPMDRQYRKPRG